MSDYKRPVWAEIDLSAIAANVETLCNLIQPPTQFLAVVKADGYGHGAVQVAETAVTAGAHRLGVALIEEALELRAAGIDVPIHILAEIPAQGAHEIVEHDLVATVCSKQLPEAISAGAVRRGRTAKVHVKVDTGMQRIGLDPRDVREFLGWCTALPNVEVEGICTHFATAERPDLADTVEQKDLFLALLRELEHDGLAPSMNHAANSAATILMPETHLDIVRCGIAIYGLHPGPATAQEVALKPALSLKTRVSWVKKVPAGKGISYGHTFRPDRETTIVTLPLGYADGYTRMLSNRASVLIGGRRLPIAGTVCMDQFMVDAGPDSDIAVDDEAILIGRSGSESITADELAHILGTINYEIVCMISKRVPRIYV